MGKGQAKLTVVPERALKGSMWTSDLVPRDGSIPGSLGALMVEILSLSLCLWWSWELGSWALPSSLNCTLLSPCLSPSQALRHCQEVGSRTWV